MKLIPCWIVLFGLVAVSASAVPLFETVTVHAATEKNRPNYRIPAIITAPNGDVIIFTEKRNSGIGDIGDHDLVCVRSTDFGKTWGPEQVIFDDGENTCTDTTIVIDKERGRIFTFFLQNKKKFAYFSSDDSGKTWKGPVVVHDSVVKAEWDRFGLKGKEGAHSQVDPESGQGSLAVRWQRNWFQRYGIGPGAGGVQLTQGPKKGRLIVPARHLEELPGGARATFSHIFYSDDHGATWQLGPNVLKNGNECRMVELPDGTLMMSMRNANGDDQPDNSRRLVKLSKDGGDTWHGAYRDDALASTTVHAGLRVYDFASSPQNKMLLFSNPAAPIRQKEHPYGRYNMTVRWSLDDGKHWTAGRVIYPHTSSYSDMTVLPDGSIGIVYERGAKNSVKYWDEIQFARFNVEWLLAPAHTSIE
ncbi:sialidase family protein [Oleiharenicola lentus]|uniref:sialidase family protein n=1 Tax=Oleiharenicola lentus TaxID=2508720 RepID=UPI003F665737